MPDALSAHDAFGHWLSGFTAGEGHFNLFQSRQAQTRFVICLRQDDAAVIDLIREYWGGIGVHRRTHPTGQSPQSWLDVGGIHEISRVLIPHFERYPLRTRKAEDFTVWSRAARLHAEIGRRPQGLRGKGNGSGAGFRWTPAERLVYIDCATKIKAGRQYEDRREMPAVACAFDDAWCSWLAGFFAGEGHFGLELSDRGSALRPALCITITQRADNTPIIRTIAQYFGGHEPYFTTPTRGKLVATARTRCLEGMAQTMVPFFDHFPLRTKKAAEYPIWREALFLCLEVSRRPPGYTLPRGQTRHGRFPIAWRADEVNRFLHLKSAIEQLRQYRPG
jgi:hypothetical protein